MLFDCIISQLIVKGLSKIHLISLVLMRLFSKTHQSSLTPKGGSTSHLGLLPSGKKRKPLLLVALNHFILWLADHQRSTPAAELRFAVCDRMDTNRLRAAWCLLEAFSKTHLDFLSINEVIFENPPVLPYP